jgi:hydrogenase expression/formation protein HypD
MLRVPGSDCDLLILKSRGADVRVVYSPIDCLKIARANPAKKVVFFAIGFETTAPANAMSVWQARQQGLKNFSILVSHVLVPPSIASILQSPLNRVQGFLGPGHVCVVMGYCEYEPLAARYKVPIVITGFEPIDILQGTLMTIRQLEAGKAEVENQYPRVVSREGNKVAQDLINKVFEVGDRKWRGVGMIPKSGYKLRYEFREHDADRIFDVKEIDTKEPEICISGLVLRGVKKPHDCPAFGTLCTPEKPLGATMVSAEGACAAYYAYGRHLQRPATRPRSRAPASPGTGPHPIGVVMSVTIETATDRMTEPFREKVLRKCAESEKRIAFPAVPLMTDIATMTAISNDLDSTRVYVNQLRLQATANDVAMVFSSSGKSPNLIYGLEEARSKKMLSIAFSGKDGGRFPEVADYCYIVPSFSIHRIQEAHATAVHIIWDLVQIALGAEDVT